MTIAKLLMAGLCLVLTCSMAGRTWGDEGISGKESIQRETRDIAGWQVHIDRRLLADQSKATARALELLEVQLQQIERVVPAKAVLELQKVPLYFSPEYDGVRPRAEFHPDAGWLRDNGRDPVMARAVEFTNVAIFAEEVDRMPNFALHELAHAYHFLVLPDGFGNGPIKEAYERAKASGLYDSVEQWHGSGRPNTVGRSYALTDPAEYFAESTEAYFVRNDFFPFTRDQLQRHDPKMSELLGELWDRR